MNHPAPDAVTALLEVGAHLAAHPGRLPADLTPTDLTRALGHVRPAEHLVETATLDVLGAARAHGLAWPHIGAALGLSDGGARDLYKRLRARHPDYTPPLSPTLEAYTARAADLLAPVLAERSLSPFLARLAAERLGAVLLTAHWEQVDTVASWLGDDALSEPHQRLNHHYGDQAGAVREVLNAHAQDPRPVQASLVDRMRAAVGAEELTRHLHPIHPGPRPTWAVTDPHAAATLEAGLVTGENLEADDGTDQGDVDAAVEELRDPGQEPSTERDGSGPLPTATAPVKPDSGPTPERRPGYARPLERAGLSPAAAAALADPLTQLIGEVTLVSHREVNPQTRHLMEALYPTLVSQRPARVRTLLYLLPRLDLYGLNEWAPLALAISKHAPHLELLPSATDLLTAADLPTHLADDVNAVVNRGRRALVASWAPTAPAWEAGPALEQLTTAVEGGHTDQLAAALDAVAELEQVQISEHAGLGTHQHGHRWEDLVHAWRRVRPVTPAAPAWPLLAAKVFPDAAMAEAVAHLLDVSGHPLHTGALGEAETHRALDALRLAVLHGHTASLGTVLDDVLKLKPTREPVSALPEIADALRRLIHAYDQ